MAARRATRVSASITQPLDQVAMSDKADEPASNDNPWVQPWVVLQERAAPEPARKSASAPVALPAEPPLEIRSEGEAAFAVSSSTLPDQESSPAVRETVPPAQASLTSKTIPLDQDPSIETEEIAMSETETVQETVAPEVPVAKTDEELAARLKDAQNMTRNYMFASLGTGLIPVPTVDIGILVGIQTRLLYKLAKLYDLKFTDDLGKKLLLSLLGGTLPVAGGMGVASMLKAFPGVGSWLGMTSMSVFGAAATYAVGRVFIQHFESGGNFFTFDPSKMRAYFREEYEAGKKVAEQMRADQKAA